MTEPTLTVFLPNYNHARFLPNALEGIASQTYCPLEFIIVDDGSTDNSVEIIESFARSHDNVRLIRNEVNRGVVANQNDVLEMAGGDYFCSVASDDRLRPEFFHKAMSLLAEHPQAAFCSTLSDKIDEEGKNLGVYPTPKVSESPAYLSPAEALAALLQHGSWFMGNTTIWRHSSLLKAGKFRPELGAFSDGFMSQLLALQHGVCFIPEVLGEFRVIPGQVSEATYDVRTAFPMYRHAIELMRTTYSDIFPAAYIDAFERRTLAYTMERSIARSNQLHGDFLKELVPRPRLIDRVLLFAAACAMKGYFLAAKVFLVIAVRHEFWSSLGRVLKKMVSCCFGKKRRRGD